MKYILGKVHALYEPGYIMPCTGNLMEEKYYVSAFDLPLAYEY
jgi:hypothetical protein